MHSALVAYGYDLGRQLHTEDPLNDSTEQARHKLLTAAGYEATDAARNDDPWHLITQLSERCGLHILTYTRHGERRSFLAAWTRSVQADEPRIFTFDHHADADHRLSAALWRLDIQPDHMEPRWLLIAEHR